MIGTARATWVQLRRPVLMLTVYLATAAMTWAITRLNFAFADEAGGAEASNGIGRTVAELERPAGATAGLSVSVFGFGILLFCVAAAVFGGYWSLGTLRALLVREPRRVRFVVGSWLAHLVFAVGAVAVSAAVSILTSLVVADGYGVSTTAWGGADGIRATLLAVSEAGLACTGYVTFGAALGLLLRATVPAVAIGFGWLFIVESLVPQASPGAYRWLPGQLLGGIAAGGTGAVPFGTALGRTLLYVSLVTVPAVLWFRRRDVQA